MHHESMPPRHAQPRHLYLRLLLGLAPMLGIALFPLLGGCQFANLVGIAAGKPPIAAAYSGLKAQRVGIMVWADRGITIDHPSVQPDVAKGLEEKLQVAATAKVEDVRDITWMEANEILRFQEAHPELETESALEVAKRLNVTRLIYLEVGNLSLHPNESVDLSRGSIIVDLKVVEVTNGQSRTGYEEQNIEAVYPPHAPVEGLPGLEDNDLYHNTIDAITSEVAKRFLTHDADAK